MPPSLATILQINNNEPMKSRLGQQIFTQKLLIVSQHFIIISDVDECSEEIHTCNPLTSNCKNAIGDYVCPCIDGFQVSGNKKCEGTVNLLLFLRCTWTHEEDVHNYIFMYNNYGVHALCTTI